MRVLRLVPLVVVVVAVLASLAQPAGAASCTTKAKASFVGLGGGDSWIKSATADCVLAQQARAGAGILRQTFAWDLVEPKKGTYDFRLYDSWVGSAARHHMRILGVLSKPPAFRAHNTARHIGRPISNAAFAKYAAAAVRRYGPKGTFWSQNPSIPKLPIRDWQLWNEPNLPQYWGGKPNAKQYVKLLKAGYKAIRKVDKRADVVTAGMPESVFAGSIQASEFIPQLYKAHAAKYFTTLAINPYSRSAKGVLKEVASIRKLMNRRHDRGAKLWVTEVGWATGGPKHRYNIGAKGQARQVKILLKGLYKRRHALKLRGVIYYGWKDRKPYPPRFKDQWGLHTGLRTAKGKPKPAYSVFAQVAPKLK